MTLMGGHPGYPRHDALRRHRLWRETARRVTSSW
jgi:hypothetical protein